MTQSTMRLLRLAATGSLLALSACIGWLFPQRRGNGDKPPGIPGGDGRTMPGQTKLGRETGVMRKVVKGKREPVTLIADDKTECVVPEDKWKETSIGEKVTCDWRSP